jgi:hypothetical protein
LPSSLAQVTVYGVKTFAFGNGAHAEGKDTVANGMGAHSEGVGT